MKNITKNNSMLHRMIALVMAVVMTLTLVAIDSHFHLFADEAEVAANEVDTIDVTNVLKGYSDGHEATVTYASNKSKAKFSVNKADIADIKLTTKVGDEDITVEGKDIDVNDIKYLTYKENATDDKDKLNKNPATPTDADKTSALSENVALTTDGDKNTCVALYYAYKKDNAVVKYIYMGTAKVLYDDVAPEIDVDSANIGKAEGVVAMDGYYLVNTNATLKITFNASDSDSGVDKIVSIKSGSTEEVALENGLFENNSGSGSYTIKVYDKAGNSKELDKKIVVKRVVKGPSIKSITPKLVKKNGVDFRLPSLVTGSGYEFTVEVDDAVAGEGSEAVTISSKVFYKVESKNNVHLASCDKNADGKYVFYVSEAALENNNGVPAKVTIYAQDTEFDSSSVGTDQNGDIVFVGKTKPDITVTGASSEWTNKPQTLTVNASSSYAYIDTISYSVNGVSNDVVTGGKEYKYENKTVTVDGGTAASDGSKIYLPDGKNTITFTAKDYAGLENAVDVTVKIDKTAPELAVKSALKGKNLADNESYYVEEAETLTITSTDKNSGIKSATVSDNGTEENLVLKKGVATVNLEEVGDHELKFTVEDNAGNITTKTINVKVVKVPLSTNVVVASAVKKDANTGKYTVPEDAEIADAAKNENINWTDGVYVLYTVSGYDIGRDDVSFSNDNLDSITAVVGEDKNNTVQVLYHVTTEGKYQISVTGKKRTATDFDTKNAVLAKFIYDKTAPSLKIESTAKNKVLDPAAAEDKTYDVDDMEALTITVSDETSGIASAKVNDQKLNIDKDGKATVELNKAGKHELNFVITDKAGNETTRELTVNVVSVALTAKISIASKVDRKDEKSEYVISDGAEKANEKITNYLNWSDGIYLICEATGFKIDEDDVALKTSFVGFDNGVLSGLKEFGRVTTDVDEAKGIRKVQIVYLVTNSEGMYDVNMTVNKHFDKENTKTSSTTFYYDKTAPKSIAVTMSGRYINGVYYNSSTPTMKVTSVNDNATYDQEFICDATYTDSNGNTITKKNISKTVKENVEVSLTGAAENVTYTLSVNLTDKAKNKSNSLMVKRGTIPVKFCIDKKVSRIDKVTISDNTTGKTVELDSVRQKFDYHQKKDFKANILVSDENYISKVVVSGTCNDGEINKTYSIDYKKHAKKEKENDRESITFDFSRICEEPGVYILDIQAFDEVGNQSKTKTVSFVVDGESPKVTVDDGNKTRSNVDQTISFTVTDDYGIDPNDIQLKVSYVTYDNIYDKNAISVDGKYNVDSDGKRCVVSYVMKQKNNNATAYKFELTGKDKSGRQVTLANSNDDRLRLIIPKKNAKKKENLIKTTGDRESVGGWYYIDSTKPKIVESSLLLEDETDIPHKADGKYGYFNQNVAVYLHVVDQFDLPLSLTAMDVAYKDEDKDPHKRHKDFGSSRDGFEWLDYSVAKNNADTYNLQIKAEDGFGNIYTLVPNINFFIDKINPVVEIGNVSNINNSDVTVPVTITDNMMGSKYKVHVTRTDASGNTSYDADFENGEWSDTRFEKNYVFSDEGDYVVTVSAEDKAGNKSEVKTTKFRIDKTAPVISISGMNDKQTTGVTATISVDEAFSFNYEDKALGSSDFNVTITKKTDGTAAANVATLGKDNFTDGNPHTATYNCSEDGEYTITAIATDLARNKAAEQTKTFKVDSKAPVLKVTAVDKDSKKVENYDPIGSKDSSTPNYVDMSLSVEEAFFATDNVEISVKKDSKDVSSSYFTNYRNSAEISTGTQRFSEDGVYEVSIKAQDELGNKADDYGLVFTVDNTPPELAATNVLDKFKAKTTKTEDGSILLNADDFADILNQGYEALWNVNDTSDFSVDAKIDGVSLIDFSDLSDGYHQLTIEVTDKVGHVSKDEFDFTYDGTAPRIVITGVEDGETVREPFTMTIGLENPDDEITSIVINGNTIDPANYSANNKYEMQVQDYDTYTIEVTAKDKAGNVASTIDEDTGAVFTFKLSEKLSPVVLVIIIIAAILLIALLIFIILASKRKKKNAAA
mgnify:CR=1 FL=1